MDTEAVKACTLKRIVYPTGGYTDFDFETHDVNYTLRENRHRRPARQEDNRQ